MKRELRGITPAVILGYLDAWGEQTEETLTVRHDGSGEGRRWSVAGAHWRVTIEVQPASRVGAISLNRVDLTITGDDAATEALEEFMRVRLARGGG